MSRYIICSFTNPVEDINSTIRFIIDTVDKKIIYKWGALCISDGYETLIADYKDNKLDSCYYFLYDELPATIFQTLPELINV